MAVEIHFLKEFASFVENASHFIIIISHFMYHPFLRAQSGLQGKMLFN